jgi:glycosyltransferase involved in cell wall biosynthesis
MIVYTLFIFISSIRGNFEKEKNYSKLALNHILINKIPNEIKKPLISIVTPAYNSERTIIATIRSVQNQNFTDYEHIIVEDNSKDKTYNIILNESKYDKRIKIYKNDENMGYLYSLTQGVLYAKAKYLIQIDADDVYCNSNAFKILYNIADKKNVDIVYFALIKIRKYNFSSLFVTKNLIPPKFGLITQPELKNLLNIKYMSGPAVCNKLYKTELFQRAIKFIGEYRYKKVSFIADVIMTHSLLSLAKTLFAIPDHLIFYLTHSNSLITSRYSNHKLYSVLNALNFVYDNSLNIPEDKSMFNFMVYYHIGKKFGISAANLPDKKREVFIDFCFKYLHNHLISNLSRKLFRNQCHIIFNGTKYNINMKTKNEANNIMADSNFINSKFESCKTKIQCFINKNISNINDHSFILLLQSNKLYYYINLFYIVLLIIFIIIIIIIKFLCFKYKIKNINKYESVSIKEYKTETEKNNRNF